jgi:hypothetical protein
MEIAESAPACVLRGRQRVARGLRILSGVTSGPQCDAHTRTGKLQRLVLRKLKTWRVRALEGTARKETKRAQGVTGWPRAPGYLPR